MKPPLVSKQAQRKYIRLKIILGNADERDTTWPGDDSVSGAAKALPELIAKAANDNWDNGELAAVAA